MTDESENKSTDESTGKSKNYVLFSLIILGAPILVIVFLVVMRCAFKPPARISVMRETTTQPVPFDAKTREQVRDFVADEIDQQTGQSHQQFNALASALIAVASTILLATIGILALGWWRQTREHDKAIKEAEDYRTTTKQSADEAAKDAKRSKEYLKQIKEASIKAQELFEKADEASVKSEEAAKISEANRHFTQALIYGEKGELDKAIEEYDRSIAAKESSGAYNNRGVIWDDRGDFDKAFANYDKAIELEPEYAAAYNNRGLVWANKGKLDKAIADYNKAIELEPKDARFYSNRSVTWRKKGDHDKAITDCTNAIELEPEGAIFYSGRGTVRADKGEFDKAIKDYTMAIELDPKNASFYLNVAEALILKRDFYGAVERLEQGRDHDAFESDGDRLIASCQEGIALALNSDDASAAEAEAEAVQLQADGAKVGKWDTGPMERFLKDLKPEDFAPAALETARRIQKMLKN